MKKVILFLLLLVAGDTFAQTYSNPQPALFGIRYLRVKSDSFQHVPRLASLVVDRDTTPYMIVYRDSTWMRIGGVWFNLMRANAGAQIHDSLYAVYQLKAGTSAGGKLVSNGGTVAAEWGVGGGSNFDFHGFAGYNANRSASYTDRSFTDKKYVDSSRALDVQLAGTQTVTGAKTFSNVTSYDSTAKFFKRIIISPTGLSYAQVTGVLEDGPALFINRDISNASTVNEHGIIDATTFSRSGKAYNSYDAQATLSGSNNLDHYSGFQNRALVNLTGTVLNMYNGFHSAPNIIGGSVDTLYHFRTSTVIGANATNTLLEYGLKVGTLRGVKKYGVYVDVDSSYFGNSVIIPSGIGLTSIKTNNSRLSLLKLDAGTNRTSMTIADDFLMKNESSANLFYVNASTKAVNTYGLLTATSASTSTHGLLVNGGSSVGSPTSSSGQILIGSTSTYRGSIAYDDNTGKMYIDNLYNDNAGDIFIRTKTAGTPIDAIKIAGSGVISASSRLNVNGAVDNASYALNVTGNQQLSGALVSSGFEASPVGWEFGKLYAPGGLSLNTTNYVSVKIGGITYKLALVN